MRPLLVTGLCGLLFGCGQQDPTPTTSAAQPEQATDKPLYLSLQTPPAPIQSPAEALADFVIAPGYTIELAAAEPLIEDPVAADWDEEGNLYVAEMRAYMPDTEGTGEEAPIGAVVRLVDADGDGVFDERQVLIDSLVLPRALRIVNEGLLIAEMGKLWLCPSNSGWSRDIDCSAKQFLGAYGEHQGSVEHAENGLLVGLDNWLYSAKSSRRLKLVDGELIQQPTLFRGQWGITQGRDGHLFYNTNSNMILGDYFDAQAIVQAGSGSAPGLNQRISPDDEVFSVRVNPGVNRAYVPGVLRADGRLRSATSASGLVAYQGGLFAADAPDMFVAEPAANLVAAYTLGREGLKISAEHQLYPDEQWGQRDFLASYDERFRPVDVLNGPDGAVYVIDFYRGIIQDHVFLSDELKAQVLERGLDTPLGMGRIWRIVPDDVAPAFTRLDWAGLNAQALVDLLGSHNVWQQATAQRLLLRRQGAEVSGLLAAVLQADVAPAAQVRAIWILADRGELQQGHVLQGLKLTANVAEAALLAGGHQLSVAQITTVLQQAQAQAQAGSGVFLYALGALRGAQDSAAVVKALKWALAHTQDVYVQTFVQAASRGREFDLLQSLVTTQQWREADEVQDALLQSLAQQMLRAEGKGVTPLLDFIVTAPQWVQIAVLNGLFEVTRENGFNRVVLDAPHVVFEPDDESLWVHTSKARRAFTWPGDTLAADAKPLTPAQQQRMAAGAQFFAASCANCHGADGAGVGALGPPLADSVWVTQAPERLARIVLHGLMGPIEVAGTTWNSAMPGHRDFANFDDDTFAGLLTYLRRSWGHSGRAIDPGFVRQIRAATRDRTALWTVAELNDVAINTHFKMYEGAFGNPAGPLVFSYDDNRLNVASGIFNGTLKETKEDHFLFEPRGLQFEFVIAEDGSVPAVRMATPDGGVSLPRVQP